MSGIMRAPSHGAKFSIPYSGTHAVGDCILVTAFGASPDVCAYYNGSNWAYKDYVTDFSDENNVISFVARYDNDHAAFIPGPNHV